MNKEEAIKWFKEIGNGVVGVDRTLFPDELKGRLAKNVWDDSIFTYGIEYGVLIALCKVFGITEDDILKGGQ